MTLSAFLRDYLYISLGGNRRGKACRYVNLVITMVLGGLWHGANWTFVLWGTLHGFYLVVNHAWLALREHLSLTEVRGSAFVAGTITFLAVVVAWVMFRAHDVGSALHLLGGMAGLNGFGSLTNVAPHLSYSAAVVIAWLVAGLAISKLMPNCLEIATAIERWKYRGRALGFAAGSLLIYVILNFNRITTFIYFQF